MTSLEHYISSFSQKLASTDVSKLQLENYPKEYLQLLLDNKLYYLHIYADVLEKVLKNSANKKEDIILVDYGAGNGLLGIFAKFCGFKKVYLADVSEIFIDAAIQLSNSLEINLDGFVVGDCNVLKQFCENEELPDAVIGTDVIEHIYNLDEFFTCLKEINSRVITVFTTASVTSNPVKNRKLKQLQRKDELIGSEANHAVAGNEYAGLPFLETRKRLIKKHFIFFDKKMIEELAIATRGLYEADIIKAGSEYFINKKLPKPSHPTNTCDPITGSWTERLLTVNQYNSVYRQAGFSLQVFNGFYNEWQGGKGGFLKIINNISALITGFGKVSTPFITLVGK